MLFFYSKLRFLGLHPWLDPHAQGALLAKYMLKATPSLLNRICWSLTVYVFSWISMTLKISFVQARGALVVLHYAKTS
jgi:hypothetical protein